MTIMLRNFSESTQNAVLRRIEPKRHLVSALGATGYSHSIVPGGFDVMS